MQANTQTKFNANTNVVLRACSKVAMVSHKWQPKSAAIQGADITPRTSMEKEQSQPMVTVALRQPMVLSAQQDEPYTFKLTATFVSPGGTTADARSNTHEVTLQLNYVRTLVGSTCGVYCGILISAVGTCIYDIVCATATPRWFADGREHKSVGKDGACPRSSCEGFIPH